MKKASYGLLLLMVLALVLSGLAPIFATPQAAADAVASECPVDKLVAKVVAAADTERPVEKVELFIEIEGNNLKGLSTKAVIPDLRRHARTTQCLIIGWLEANGGEVHNTFWLSNLILVSIDPHLIPQLFAEFEEVEDVFPNFEVAILPPQESQPAGEGEATGEPPPPTWGVDRIRAPEVWAEGIDGTGIRIAVLDTGVHIAHPDLKGRMWTDDPDDPTFPGGWIEFDGAGNIVPGSVPHDTHGHGTHCSGTALGGATGPAAIGVAPGAWLMHGLILPGGSGTFAQIIAGMEWTIKPHDDEGNPAGAPADVVSMSFGTLGFHDAMIVPIENMRAAGIVPVAAIGNWGAGTSDSPGNVFAAFGIGATDVHDAVAWWSGGQVVDWPASHPDPYIVPGFAAPGVDVLSAVPWGWASASGTSMAAPHVAGTVALMLQHRPELTVDEIYGLLRVTGDDLGEPGQDIRYGWGIIDAFAATLPPFDFSLAVEPTAATVTQGEEVTATITATHLAGITEEVTLTYTYELPAEVTGITVTFDPSVYEPTFTSTMTIAANVTATVGEHVIIITGTSAGAGNVVKAVPFTLTVVVEGLVVRIEGSTTVKEIADLAEEPFEGIWTGTVVGVAGGGSSAGISKILEDQIDIGMASKELTTEQAELLNAYVIARDAVCVIVRDTDAMAFLDDITIAQINYIYEKGADIVNLKWSEIPGAEADWPDELVVPRARIIGSGTRDSFHDLAGIDDDLDVITIDALKAADPLLIRLPGNDEMVAAIKANDFHIGYVGLGFIGEPGIRALKVEGVMPSPATVLDGTYSLSRSLYLLTRKSDPTPNARADDLINYMFSADGQAHVTAAGFVPVPVVDPMIADFDVNKDGTVNAGDIAAHIYANWGKTNAVHKGWIRADVNNDGTVNARDVLPVYANWGETPPW